MNFIARLMPREGRFFSLFDGHAKLIVEGAVALADVLRHYDDQNDRATRIKQIEDAEHGADRITHETVQLLHTTFVTPFDRDDIHRLISRMDDMLDLIQDTAESLVLYDIQRVTPEATQLAELLLRCAERVQSAVGTDGLDGRRAGHPQDLPGNRQARIRRGPRHARRDLRAVPQRDRRRASSSSSRRSTNCSNPRPTSARTWPTSSKASCSKTPDGHLLMDLGTVSLTLVFLVLLALAFDFMNGFHDAANSIATVVSTGVLKPWQAVLWAAFFNVLAWRPCST